jgi:plasmid maintenance system antidote protein VapI
MAFKLTKEEAAQLKDLTRKASEKEDAFRTIVRKSEDIIQDAVSAINDARFELNELIVEANEFREAVATRLREEFDDKSDNWKEGEKGSEVDSFISQWETDSQEEIDDVPLPELELPEIGLHNGLEELPEEV